MTDLEAMQQQLDAMHRQIQAQTRAIHEFMARMVVFVDLSAALSERVAFLEEVVGQSHCPSARVH